MKYVNVCDDGDVCVCHTTVIRRNTLGILVCREERCKHYDLRKRGRVRWFLGRDIIAKYI